MAEVIDVMVDDLLPEWVESEDDREGEHQENIMSASDMSIAVPLTEELESTVVIVHLAQEKGIDVERWLLIADLDAAADINEENEVPSDDEDTPLISSEDFAARILSLSMVVATHETRAVCNLINLGVSATALASIEDFFGICATDVKSPSSDDDDDSDGDDMFVDVRQFLLFCYEKMQTVSASLTVIKNKEAEQLQERMNKALQQKQQQSQLQQKRHEAMLRANTAATVVGDSIATTDITGAVLEEEGNNLTSTALSGSPNRIHEGTTVTPNTVISKRSHIAQSPFDEEVTFDLDGSSEDEGNSDGTLGSDGLPINRKKKAQAHARAATALAKGKSKSKNMNKNTKNAAAAAIRKFVPKEKHYAVVEDLLRTFVRQSDAYLKLRKRLGFVKTRDTFAPDSFIGPPRTALLPKTYGSDKKSRFECREVAEGFLAGHMVLSEKQIAVLFSLVEHFARRMRLLLKQQLHQQQLQLDLTTRTDMTSSTSSSQGVVSPSRSVKSSHSHDSTHSMTSQDQEKTDGLISPRQRASKRGPTAVQPLSPTRAQLELANTHASMNSTSRASLNDNVLRDSITSAHSSTLSLAHALPASHGGIEGLTTVTVKLQDTGTLRDITIPSGKMRAIVKNKISSTWLEFYLQYLRRTKKTESVFVETADTSKLLPPPQTNIHTTTRWHGGAAITPSSAMSYVVDSQGVIERDDEQGDSDYTPGHDSKAEDTEDTYDSGAGDASQHRRSEPALQRDSIPTALVKALNGQVHLCAVTDKELDHIVCKYSQNLISDATLHGEVRIRLHRWVGNVDAGGDYAQRLRVALKLSAYKLGIKKVKRRTSDSVEEVKSNNSSPIASAHTDAKTTINSKDRSSENPTTPMVNSSPATPASANTEPSGATGTSSDADKSHQITGSSSSGAYGLSNDAAQRCKRALLRAKKEEILTSERLDSTITRELFWKYIAYCRDNHRSIADKSVCSWDEWLIWRHNNFSETHKDILRYKRAAMNRLQNYHTDKSNFNDIDKFTNTTGTAISALTMTTSMGISGSYTESGNRGKSQPGNVAFGRSVISTKPLEPPSPPPVGSLKRLSNDSMGGKRGDSNGAYGLNVSVPVVPSLKIDSNKTKNMNDDLTLEQAALQAKIKAKAEEKRLRDINFRKWMKSKIDAEEDAKLQKKEQKEIILLKKRIRKAAVLKAHQEWLKQREMNCYTIIDKNTGKKVLKLMKKGKVNHISPWNPFVNVDEKKKKKKIALAKASKEKALACGTAAAALLADHSRITSNSRKEAPSGGTNSTTIIGTVSGAMKAKNSKKTTSKVAVHFDV